MLYNDEQLMRRCFELASMGAGKVAPNPMVGALIVCNGEIIGEGYHSQYGEPHAEVMAILSVKDKSLLKQSTIYVNLEPCCHYGKTPPCSQLIYDMEIPKVVIAAADPFHKVNGGGIKFLRDKGVDVTVGVLQKEALYFNRFFYTYHQKKRPYIILKWAQSIDGYIDSDRASEMLPVKITSKTSHALLHKWRSQIQAIMVGTNTIIRDNPRLTTRNWSGKSPLRIVLNQNNRIPTKSLVFDNESDTLVFVSENDKSNYGERVNKITIDFKDNFEEALLNELYKLEIQSLFIEGGAMLINTFFNKNLWDEARIFIGNSYIGKGVKAPKMPKIKPNYYSDVGNDRLFVFTQNNL